MTRYYFIPGLGGNRSHAQDLFEELPFEVQFLSLPTAKDLISAEDLRRWFEKRVDLSGDIVLIGHSIGGDLAAYLANQYQQITKLVLLDGGIWSDEVLPEIESEITDMRAYLKQTRFDSLDAAVAAEKESSIFWSSDQEEAVKASLVWDGHAYRLNLSATDIEALLRSRRDWLGAIQSLSDKLVLLVIPDLGDETPEFKAKVLETVPDFVHRCAISEVGHGLYTENPHQVARIIEQFLENHGG
ncbi:alpha/beta fold hydrolase [Streptococcus merionis]|uniref:alpha/beta fold hydrolase n=1 Tax=Streptococcus merionis TaxID=400065 RepID=UPI0026E924CF|nr:alpha/beta hydrolase [Streptococcus merionis]